MAYQAISLSYLSELIRAISSSVHNAVNLKATTASNTQTLGGFHLAPKTPSSIQVYAALLTSVRRRMAKAALLTSVKDAV